MTIDNNENTDLKARDDLCDLREVTLYVSVGTGGCCVYY